MEEHTVKNLRTCRSVVSGFHQEMYINIVKTPY